ncbi:pogo transposable element with znf domain [Plakobranchus ocellatus]|uniref:Pogo transposable element with znf domain n=1 Tax=Plakobranchus ocellatus TaxID=259542 RepID=A0AAV3ZML9_9GAST|nr:pogo transposable element with znf domain [Plakobranchus ocellatus]
MPQNKVRKTDRGTFESDDMEAAVLAVVEHGQSIRKVAKDFSLKRTILALYVKEKKQAEDPETVCYKKSHITKQVFGQENEKLFVEYDIQCSKMFHGLSVKAVTQLAYNYAKRNNKVYPAS